MGESDFDQVVVRYHRALADFFRGNPDPAIAFFSHEEDVSLGNPFDPFVRGWKEACEAARRAASNYRYGQDESFDNVVKYVASDLALLVEVEGCKARIGGKTLPPWRSELLASSAAKTGPGCFCIDMPTQSLLIRRRGR